MLFFFSKKNSVDSLEYLPQDLRELVFWSVALLGEIIQKNLGTQKFRKIEKIRTLMKDFRVPPSPHHQMAEVLAQSKTLKNLLNSFRELPREEQYEIAHAFAVMLELINRCENAFRTFRIRERSPAWSLFPESAETPEFLIFVLTAHPTESRSRQSMAIFDAIQRLLLRFLTKRFKLPQGIKENFHHNTHSSFDNDLKEELLHLLEMAWHLPLSKTKAPRVEDEAAHIYSIVLNPKVLSPLLRLQKRNVPVYLRTWVGGDKDGHPGVDERKMLKSFGLSRRYFLNFIHAKIKEIQYPLHLLEQKINQKDLPPSSYSLRPLYSLMHKIHNHLEGLKKIRRHDGKKVLELRKLFVQFQAQYQLTFHVVPLVLNELLLLLKSFPGLVVPLELRESKELVAQAISPSPKEGEKILRMLKVLHLIAQGGNPKWYVRGLVISMVESAEDIRNGKILIQKTLGSLKISLIPLFETAKALENSPQIVQQTLNDPEIEEAISKNWKNRFEVMVGYSDSSKENGVLPSRILIAKALHSLNQILRKQKITPLFFHGQGGSIERGGGSIQEQIQWWPKDCLQHFKVTLQGEMIQRTFSSPEILEGQIEKIATQIVLSKKSEEESLTVILPPLLQQFASSVQKEYQNLVYAKNFMKLVEEVSPYPYLKFLKIGSRPTKRKTAGDLKTLRAIPWILCWTQTRILFPTWWGVGTAYEQLTVVERKALKKIYQTSPLFSSFVKLLGFTLAKVELPIWKIYLETSQLSSKESKAIFHQFSQEFEKTLKFFKAMSDEENLLWFRQWLGESIRLRSPNIHPLNLLQIVALENQDAQLLRETVTGIACGMLTTG